MTFDPAVPQVLVLAAVASVLLRKPVARVGVRMDALLGLRTTERYHEWLSIVLAFTLGALGAWAAFVA